MARGTEAKQRRKTERKEARGAAKESEEPGKDVFEEVLRKDGLAQDAKKSEDEDDDDDDDDTSSDEDEYEDSSSEDEKEDIMTKATKKSSKKSSSGKSDSKPCCPKPSSSGKGIKPLPLIFLIMMTGTTVLPLLFYMGDHIGNYMQNNHIMGSIGFKFGIGATPKRRVMSFYEKHEPSKVPEVPKLLSRYYGDYPKLIKRLERKYNDYGYFLQWQEDEAPSKLAKAKLWETHSVITKYIDVQFQSYAPPWLKSRVRNVRYNLKKLWKKGRKVWRNTLWPLLEPIFGVPKGGASQKRKDRNDHKKSRGRGKYAFRDEDEGHDTDGFSTEE